MRNLLVAVVLILYSFVAAASDKLVVLSPHRKSIQEEFIPAFKDYYQKTFQREVEVDWLDLGGTADDIRFLKAKFAKNPKTSGVDIFWGGGTNAHVEVAKEGFLARYNLPKPLAIEIPESVAGIPLYDQTRTWYGSALSSFGIFYNKLLLKLEKLPEPRQWADLGDPLYLNNIVQADPRKSGTSSTMNHIIVQAMGWEKGWQMLTALAGNTRHFSHSSSDPIKAVITGNVALSLSIDFYANAKIGDLGSKNLGFVMPEGQTILDSDPVAIVKGAPNLLVAQRFVEFVLNAQTQKLLVLPQKSAQGPKLSTLGRMAVNTQTYIETQGLRTNEFNPFKSGAFLKLDSDKASRLTHIMNDLAGALLIDTHRELKKAWQVVGKSGDQSKALLLIGAVPVTEKEVEQLALKWNDQVLRNHTINSWVQFARKKYISIAKPAS